MSTEFLPRMVIPLQPGTSYDRPVELPELVHLDSPAVEVMTDFRVVRPVTIGADASMDEALERMKRAGIRLLLVTDNEEQSIIGVLSAKDVQGERPVRYAKETGIPHSQIRVRAVMTAQPLVTALNMLSVQDAEVGHIIETLRKLGRQHVLVVEVDLRSHAQRVRGLFSMSQISKQLGVPMAQIMSPAETLAEIVHGIG